MLVWVFIKGIQILLAGASLSDVWPCDSLILPGFKRNKAEPPDLRVGGKVKRIRWKKTHSSGDIFLHHHLVETCYWNVWLFFPKYRLIHLKILIECPLCARHHTGAVCTGVTCNVVNQGSPTSRILTPDDLRWSWCNNNRNKVHNKCNALESSWNHPPPSHGPWKNCLP